MPLTLALQGRLTGAGRGQCPAAGGTDWEVNCPGVQPAVMPLPCAPRCFLSPSSQCWLNKSIDLVMGL